MGLLDGLFREVFSREPSDQPSPDKPAGGEAADVGKSLVSSRARVPVHRDEIPSLSQFQAGTLWDGRAQSRPLSLA